MAFETKTARFWVETLGCPKNAVDSDKVTASLLGDGMIPADNPEGADLVVVNTCAFVEAARQESIDTVLDLAARRQAGARVVVTGCLAERYGEELATSLPEVDAVVGFAGEGSLAKFSPVALTPISLPVQWAGGKSLPVRPDGVVRDLLELPRSTPTRPWAYLKIAEGCDRACAFCAIPSFRGAQRSRSPEVIMTEARELVEAGVVELVLVAQDPAWYGRDIGAPGALAGLLQQLDSELGPSGLLRVRILYLYPSEVKGELVRTMLELPTPVPYFDLSLQHADRALLARMKRWGGAEKFMAMIDSIRDQEPTATFRSSFIVGFPGETESAHESLLEFLSAAQLDWAGFFPFSPEEGTAANSLDQTVTEELMNERLRECEEVQTPITQGARDAIVASETDLEVLLDEVDPNTGIAVGRSHREAPEIDGLIHISGGLNLTPGVMVKAKAQAALGPDLYADFVRLADPDLSGINPIGSSA